MYFEMMLKNIDPKLLPKQSDQDWMKSNKQMESSKDMEEDKNLEVSMFEPPKKKKKKKVLLDSDIFVSNVLRNKIESKSIDGINKKKSKPKPTAKKILGRHNGKTSTLTKSQTKQFSKLQESNNQINAHHGSRAAKLDKHLAQISRSYNKNK